MDSLTVPGDARRRAAPPAGTALEPSTLARALRHLLRRDGEYPAAWRTARFGAAVDETRQRGRIRQLPGVGRHAVTGGDRTSFGAAVTRLGGDPTAVALAIGHLEATLGHPLPRWAEILRSADVGRPSEEEIRTWFG